MQKMIIDYENIEQSQIIQTCGYLALTEIQQMGAALQVVINNQLRDLSQMESI